MRKTNRQLAQNRLLRMPCRFATPTDSPIAWPSGISNDPWQRELDDRRYLLVMNLPPRLGDDEGEKL